jgi:hypothetical protein
VLLDIVVLVGIAAVVAGLVVLQIASGDEGGDRAAPTSQQDGPVQHSTLGPSPTPSTPATDPASSTPPATSTGPTTSAPPAPPQPGAEASDLARSAQSVAASPSIFRIATFNVLGASHTRKGGDSRIKTPYGQRMTYTVRALANHHVDVIGFQEFEPPQAKAFQAQMGAGWGMFPRPGSDEADGRQTIAWREETMELVAARTVTYPYFGGHPVHTPAVQLRMRATEDTFWVISVHNPATNCAVCGGNNDRWRSAAVQREVQAIKALSADGTPVFLVGDMNSKRNFFCQMSAALPVVFAAGGSYAAGACRPPQPTPIDWILATAGVTFSGYLSDDSPLVDAASDHPVNSVTAMLP